MSSSRLPGKVLAPLAGEPALARMMERVLRIDGADHRVVATSTDPSDDPVADACARRDIHCARGALDDVLARFLVAVPADHEIVVRLTGDCPLVDPDLVDRHLQRFLHEQPHVDYVSNVVERTMPDGLDVEVLTRPLLEEAQRRASSEFDREHVTPWIRRHARCLAVTQEVNLSALRWTLDTARDYEVLAAIYDELHPSRADFDSREVYELLLRRPELIHVAGSDEPSDTERAAWLGRIETHLANEV
jgi:spore coat polysaccharide biosynthesis protein SpsF